MNANPQKQSNHFDSSPQLRLLPEKSGFDLSAFAARERRRVDRLVRAAYGVGHTQPQFLKMTRAVQEKTVREWVDEALESREIRLGQVLPR